jgi:hypothetical protein
MRSLEQLKKDAEEIKRQRDDVQARTAEHTEINELRQNHYRHLSDEIVRAMEGAITIAESLRIKRAIIGVVANDAHANSLPIRGTAGTSHPTEYDSVRWTVEPRLPTSVRLQALDAHVLLSKNLQMEGRADIQLTEPEFRLVEVYVPQSVPISHRARLEQGNGIVLLVEWD